MENIDKVIEVLCETICERNEQISNQNLIGLTQALTNLGENKEIFSKKRQEIDWDRFHQKLKTCIQKQIEKESNIEGKIVRFRNIFDFLDKMLEIDFSADIEGLNKRKQLLGMCRRLVDLMEVISDEEKSKKEINKDLVREIQEKLKQLNVDEFTECVKEISVSLKDKKYLILLEI